MQWNPWKNPPRLKCQRKKRASNLSNRSRRWWKNHCLNPNRCPTRNQRLNPNGGVTLDTWSHGPISFDIIGIHEPGGIDFPLVFNGLKRVGYDGVITVHQSAPEDGTSPTVAAAQTAEFLRRLC